MASCTTVVALLILSVMIMCDFAEAGCRKILVWFILCMVYFMCSTGNKIHTKMSVTNIIGATYNINSRVKPKSYTSRRSLGSGCFDVSLVFKHNLPVCSVLVPGLFSIVLFYPFKKFTIILSSVNIALFLVNVNCFLIVFMRR